MAHRARTDDGLAPPANGGLTILAASSLTEALQSAGAAWTAQGHASIRFSFDASSRLAKQVEAGTPADLYIAADSTWMDYLAEHRLIDAHTRVNLLGNGLVAIVPAHSAMEIATPADLAIPGIAHLALAGESVPAGAYARAALTTLGVWDKVSRRVVNGDNVRTVLGWVATGEAEAGVVYATDARVDRRVRVAFAFPDSSHAPIVYPAAVLHGAPRSDEAAAFLEWCQTTEGMAIFVAAGFSPGG